MRSIEFTYSWYADLMDELRGRRYEFRNFHDDVVDGSVVVRHDVDWSPRKAVRLAEIEAERDVTTTYLFLVSSPFYNVANRHVRECIEDIRRLGHEIGLHFSTHQYFSSTPDGEEGEEPGSDELVRAIDSERSILSTVSGSPIETVSFHNPPSWTFRRSFEDFASTYEKRFFDDIAYFADSNQRWREDSPFQDELASKIQILTHPVLWGEDDASSTDRLRKERGYLHDRIDEHLEVTDRTWREER